MASSLSSLTLLWVVSVCSGADARAVASVAMSEQIEVEGRCLYLNGAARQRVFLFDLYALGLYLERPTSSAAEAVDSEQVKRLQLTVLSDLPRSLVASALRKGFTRSVGEKKMAPFEERLNRLLSQLRDPRKKDRLTITYLPGQGTVLQDGPNVRAVIPGKDFADALFSIWLGPNTTSPHLRRALTSG